MVKDDFFFKSATLNKPRARAKNKSNSIFNLGKSSLKNPTMNVLNSGKPTRNNLIVRSKSFNVLNHGKPARNIFNSGKSTKPVNLFGDKDKDGVSNVFDCKPNNPNEEGFFAAVVGAVKGAFKKGGSAKAGWREGMDKGREHLQPRKRVSKTQFRREKTQERTMDRIKLKVEKEEAKKAAADKKKGWRKNVGWALDKSAGAAKTIHRAVSPTAYTREGEPYKQTWHEKIYSKRRAIQTGHVSREDKSKRAVRKDLARLAFPVSSGSSSSSSTVKGRSYGRRGRPSGSYALKYAKYGGVFGYRKAKAAQKALMKYKEQVAAEKARTQAMPQYETQQYTPEQAQQAQQQVQQQVPEEVQGATPEYSQFEEMQAQAQQEQPQQEQYQQEEPQYQPEQQLPPPQYAPEPQKRPIGRVFKSYGGSPYPAVDTRPLASTRQTIPYGYVEAVDGFTGRRFLKKLPQAENWAKPKEQRY